jgi:methyl-accepting chemotaxis protein
MTTQRLDSINQRIIALVDSIHELREATRQQGGVLSSGIAALAEQATEFRADMARPRAEFRADMADIKATTQRQAETADRLSRIVELLVEELRQK